MPIDNADSPKQRHVTACRSNRKGFTLLEILVALSIISFALVGVYRLYTQTLSMNYSLSFNTKAPFLAQKKITEVMALPAEDLQDDTGDFGEWFAGYTWSVSIEDVVSEYLETTAEDLKRIDVEVSLNSDEHIYRLRRYRFIRD